MSIRPYYVCGPTASGKSARAIALAKQWDGEIVNADAFQLYRGLETITAAPSPEEQAQVPHHLYSVLDPSDTCDAQRFCSLAQPVIDAIIARGKIPIVTGGSGLYLKFLTHGPSPLPQGNASIRTELNAISLEDLIAELQSIDPTEAAQINLKNRRYVSRAVEIFRLSGIPASQQRRNWEHVSAATQEQLQGIVLQLPRQELHQRIAERSMRILQNGAIDEVKAHREHLSETCRKAIGVPQILELLDGTIDQSTCLQKIIEATRQYAKRQETWFRRETWLTPFFVDPQA
jgi:tRNA dimethylallyltransferase